MVSQEPETFVDETRFLTCSLCVCRRLLRRLVAAGSTMALRCRSRIDVQIHHDGPVIAKVEPDTGLPQPSLGTAQHGRPGRSAVEVVEVDLQSRLLGKPFGNAGTVHRRLNRGFSRHPARKGPDQRTHQAGRVLDALHHRHHWQGGDGDGL